MVFLTVFDLLINVRTLDNSYTLAKEEDKYSNENTYIMEASINVLFPELSPYV